MKIDFNYLKERLSFAEKKLSSEIPFSNEKPPTPAAVLIPIYEKNDEHYILFTKRTEKLRHHKGQISFPGGKFDPTDKDLKETALRESYEEIGLKDIDVEIIGSSAQMITNTNFIVTPFAGTFKYPYEFNINKDETDYLIEVPLKHLVDKNNFKIEEREVMGQKIPIYFYSFGEHIIWGVTGKILYDFFRIIEITF